MPFKRKERKKKWRNKVRTWNREIKLEPFLHMRAVIIALNGGLRFPQNLMIKDYTKLRSTTKGRTHQQLNTLIPKRKKYGTTVSQKAKSKRPRDVSVNPKAGNDKFIKPGQSGYHDKKKLKTCYHYTSLPKKEIESNSYGRIKHAISTNQNSVLRTKIVPEELLDSVETESTNHYNNQDILSVTNGTDNVDLHNVCTLQNAPCNFHESEPITTNDFTYLNNVCENHPSIEFIHSSKNDECCEPNRTNNNIEKLNTKETEELELELKRKSKTEVLQSCKNSENKFYPSSEKLVNDSKLNSEKLCYIKSIVNIENHVNKILAIEHSKNKKNAIIEECILDEDKNEGEDDRFYSIKSKMIFEESGVISNLNDPTIHNDQRNHVTENLVCRQFYDDLTVLETDHTCLNTTKDSLSLDSLIEEKKKLIFYSTTKHNHREDIDKNLINKQKYSDEISDKFIIAETINKPEGLMKGQRYYDKTDFEQQNTMTNENPTIQHIPLVQTLKDVKEFSNFVLNDDKQLGITVDTKLNTSKFQEEINSEQLTSQLINSIKLVNTVREMEDNISDYNLYSNIIQLPYIKKDHINSNRCTLDESVPEVSTNTMDPSKSSLSDYDLIKNKLANEVKKMRVSNSNTSYCSMFENRIGYKNFNVINNEKEESELKFNPKTKQIENCGIDELFTVVSPKTTAELNFINQINEDHENQDYNDIRSNTSQLSSVAGLETTTSPAKEIKLSITQKLIRSFKRINPWQKKQVE